jgi:hypothetical protein
MRTISRWIEFPFHDRPLLQLSDPAKIRVHPTDHVLRLRPNAAGKYPTDANLYIRGPEINPTAVRSWRAVQVFAEEARDPEGTIVGTVRYRCNDGTTDRWWNGSAWAAAAAGQWNTHADLQAHLPTFPVTSRKLRLVFNLKTTDASYTPTVRSVQLLFDADILSDLEELIYRSLIVQLETIRVPVEVVLPWPGGTTADLDAVLTQAEPVQFDAVTAVFDHTADPTHLTDLLSGYNTASHVVTLTGAVTAGHQVVIRLAAQPEVAYTTHPDFNEISRLPAIAIDSVTEQFRAQSTVKQSAVNVGTLAALVVPAPRQSDFVIGLRMIANRGLDLVRLSDAVKTWIACNRTLRIASLDAAADLVVDRQIDASPRPDAIHMAETQGAIRLVNVPCWIFPAEAGHGIGRLAVSGSMDATAE